MLGYDMSVSERGVRGTFVKEFLTRHRKAKYTQLCTVVDSDKEEEKYAMIGTLPQLAEVGDERVLAGFMDRSYTLKNLIYMTGIRIPRTMFEHDQTGQIRTLVQSMGARVSNFPDKLAFTALGAGTVDICYDGQAMFAATHLGSGDTANQNNIVTSANVSNALLDAAVAGGKTDRDNLIAELQADLWRAIAAISIMVDDRGEPWHEDAEAPGLVILCHPKLAPAMNIVVNGDIISDTSNLTKGLVNRVMQTNYPQPFTDTGGPTARYATWFLAKVDTPIQPLIFQRFGPKTSFPDTIPEADQGPLKALQSVEVQTIMRGGDMISAHTFFDDEFLVGARAEYKVGYGMWQNMIMVKSSDWA